MMVSKDGYGLLCPRRPTTHQGENLARDFASKLLNLRTNPDTEQDFKFLLEYYISNARHAPNEIMFNNEEDAQRFYQVLQKIGIKKNSIYLTWHHGKDIKGLSNTKRIQYWRKALGLSKNQKICTKRINSRPFGEHGKLSIRILDYLNGNKSITQSTEAFRFVFLMCYIVYGADT